MKYIVLTHEIRTSWYEIEADNPESAANHVLEDLGTLVDISAPELTGDIEVIFENETVYRHPWPC